MFFNNKVRIAKFKPPKQELPPWAQPEPPQTYKFNSLTGIPDEVQSHIDQTQRELGGSPLAYRPHVNQQAQLHDRSHGVHLHDIPGINASFPLADHGFSPVEVEHNGKSLTKMTMRGPLSDTEDATLPIDLRGQQPTVNTVFRNRKDDTHNSLDLRRVHLPEEYRPGQPPLRRLITKEEAQAPGYRPLHANHPESLNQIRHEISKLQNKKAQ